MFSYYLQTAKTGKELVLTLRIVLRTFARVEKQGWCYAIRGRTTVTEENALLVEFKNVSLDVSLGIHLGIHLGIQPVF